MDKPRHLLIAADCGTQIGTGHVMRCLAIAQSWKRYGGEATFFLPEGSPGIEERVRTEGFLFHTFPQADFASSVVKGVTSIKPVVTVLDGYQFSASEQSSLSSAGLAVMTIDDYGHAAEYPVRWVLNQNVGAQPETYTKRNSDTRLLLGPEYALLRHEFLPWLGWKRQIPEKAGKVLVTIGGSDPNNLSLKILEGMAVLSRPELQVVMVVGGSNPHLQALQSATKRLQISIRIVQNAHRHACIDGLGRHRCFRSWRDFLRTLLHGGSFFAVCGGRQPARSSRASISIVSGGPRRHGPRLRP